MLCATYSPNNTTYLFAIDFLCGKHRSCSSYHAHIVINAVSSVDGLMYNSNVDEINRYANYVAEMTTRQVKWVFRK